MRRLLSLLGCALAVGCTHSDLPTNAPGNVDPRVRPARAEDRVPRDPGEQAFVLAYGGTGGGGVHIASGENGAVLGGGPELSAFYGRSAQSHQEGGFLTTPQTAFGANVGATFLTSRARGEAGLPVGIGPQLYAEAAMRVESVDGIALGWAVDASDGRSGPQLTVNLGPLMVRGTHVLDGGGTFLVLGLALKGQHAFFWSR